MEQYLKDEQQEKLKDMLYGYLKDKAQRREGVTSKATYEGAEDQFVNQMRLRDVGSLAGALSEAGSMAGQIQGKRAQSDIIPNVNKDLYGSTQGAYENFRTLRDTEERSNMNDLNVARYVSQMEQANDADKLSRRKMDLSEKEYADLEPRRQLELRLKQKQLDAQPAMRRRLQPNLVSPGGNPVTLDDEGNPSELPGYKYRETPQKSELPKGFTPRKPSDPAESAPKKPAPQMNTTQAKKFGVFKMGEEAEAQYQAAVAKGKKAGTWDPTGYGDFIDNTRQLPNFAKDPAAIEADAAMQSWGDTYLRDESGAAIPDSERAAYYKIYFPQMGDTPQAVANKARLRRQKMDNAREASGADSDTPSQSGGNGPNVGDVVKGYRFLGGDPADKSNWERAQ